VSVKNGIAHYIRKANLAQFADKVRFYLKKVQYSTTNRHFKKIHPEIKLPPERFIYETYKLNYEHYFTDGLETAKEILELINRFLVIKKEHRILDWGCGPARITRHIPVLGGNNFIAFGTDSNREYIKWNQENIGNVIFKENRLNPPLNFEENYFDIVFGFSVLTHLSIEKHISWIKEIHRVLKPGGLLIITTQGEAYNDKLTKDERFAFSQGKLVCRSTKTEGERIFSAFQPPAFMKDLLKDFEILEIQKGNEGKTLFGYQDTWVVKKI
jgi:SAM-dependent methyltransferase